MKKLIGVFYKDLIIIVLIIFFMNLKCAAQDSEIHAQQQKEYSINFVSATMHIDGVLNEEAWNKSATTEDFEINIDGTKPAFLSSAQMLWDNVNIYIAFTIEDNDIWSVKRTHDEKLWQDEAAEIFIDPDGDGFNYLELEVNCLGTVFDLYYKDYDFGRGEAQSGWNIHNLKVGVTIDGSVNDRKKDSKWICEVAIPFKSIAFLAKSIRIPPKEGDVWRLNLCRIERNREIKDKIEFSSWSPTYTSSFHVPERFGKIIFIKNN